MQSDSGEALHSPDISQSVDDAIAALRNGSMVVVLDDTDRENEADLIVAAQFATEDTVAFFLEHTSGLLCAAMTPRRQQQLDLSLMVQHNSDPMGTAFLVTVDLAGSTTGISAAERAATIRALADPSLRPQQLNRPGHILPLRARPGGVLERPGHTEAGVDLCGIAGISPVALICELVTPDKRAMLRGQAAVDFAHHHGFPVITIDDLVMWRRSEAVKRTAAGCLPLRGKSFEVISYISAADPSVEHLAAVYGSVSGERNIPVRVHSECITGDVLGSQRCDCGAQLNESIDRVIAHGRGALIYLRGHEGRGIGLAAKVRAYALQDAAGLDTIDANLAQGLPVDAREYVDAASIIAELQIQSIDLITNNPDKQRALTNAGVIVERRTPIVSGVNEHNIHYVQTKVNRMGHYLPQSDAADGSFAPGQVSGVR